MLVALDDDGELGLRLRQVDRLVEQARLARILWLAKLEFADESRVLPRAKGRPVYLALAMDAAQRVRCKPQNLVAGLPLLARGDGA